MPDDPDASRDIDDAQSDGDIFDEDAMNAPADDSGASQNPPEDQSSSAQDSPDSSSSAEAPRIPAAAPSRAPAPQHTPQSQREQDVHRRQEERRRKFKKHPMHFQKSESQRMHEQQAHAPARHDASPAQPKPAKREHEHAKSYEEQPARKQGHQVSQHTGFKGFVEHLYHNQYKKLLLIPVIILIIAIGIIAHKVVTTGDFIDKGVTLKGGLTITISDIPDQVIDVGQLQQAFLAKFPQSDLTVRDLSQGGIQKGVTIEASDITSDQAESLIYATLPQVTKSQLSVEVTGPSLGAAFFKQTLIILLIALLCMAVVVFAYFRIPIPSMAIMLAAISSIITTVAVINLLHVKLSTAGVAAFLMLLGYSIDTDIVLSVRVLHRKEGTFFDRTLDAMATGLTMTITALAATITALLLTHSEVIHQIMLILTIGLVCDILYTWVQNAGILRWYLEKNGAKHHLSG